MSQEQPRRPSGQQAAGGGGGEQGAVRYGDVFPAVSGGLAEKPIAPQDAATMQSAENLVFGQTLRGGPAAAMQSAATTNERMGVVGHDQATGATAVQGVTVSETRVPGGRIVTEFVAGQVRESFCTAHAFPSVCSHVQASSTNFTSKCCVVRRLLASTSRGMMMMLRLVAPPEPGREAQREDAPPALLAWRITRR